jgi:Rieske Fe-S protein
MMDDDRTAAERPIWKRDFPYEAAAEEEVTRREFARYLVAGAGVMAAGNVGIAAWTQLRTINTGEPRAIVDALERRRRRHPPVPVPDRRRPRHPAARSADTEVVAFSQKCTHLGCVVYYEAEEHRWHCPCHEGNFDARTGDVISGPPPRPSAASTSRPATTASGPSGTANEDLRTPAAPRRPW